MLILVLKICLCGLVVRLLYEFSVRYSTGGRLYFEEGATLHLKAKIIFITEGGLLQVGTEDHPYTGSATIEMYGHVRSIELPIYGTKCIALRQGTLDLHGMLFYRFVRNIQNTSAHVM